MVVTSTKGQVATTEIVAIYTTGQVACIWMVATAGKGRVAATKLVITPEPVSTARPAHL